MSSAPTALQFNTGMVRRGLPAAGWREAVTAAGDLLVDGRCVRRGYTEKLVDIIERFGPYMVIAPGLALVHAQPSADSLQRGISAVTVPDGVDFGHSHYDPVSLVIGLSTTNASEHLDIVAGIANDLEGSEGLVARAAAAESDEALVELVRASLPALALR
ncbi:PTS sugar transporter subunit IIA [Gulosibacter sp. 10]|uniref:PTS sugar transporter subunit IIA n=1 Tax=Gulosibacter sp. 10 TaxID=1255570 RepID=UPI0015955F5E|nr:PTS sugar transporter subunit IIA [Gulosibacter sp. 10]